MLESKQLDRQLNINYTIIDLIIIDSPDESII